ncbi:MAG: DUF1684 domain-containing protein [Janthinobacterium lividum]
MDKRDDTALSRWYPKDRSMMRYMHRLGVLLLAAPFCLHAQTLTDAEQGEIQQFRSTLADSMRGPQSPLNMVALYKLKPGGTTVGSAPGSSVRLDHLPAQLVRVRLADDKLQILAPASGFPKGFTIGGKAVESGPVNFDADGTSPTFQVGSVSFVLRHKFGYFLVGRDMQAPSLLAFKDLRWYQPDAHYRLLAQWKPWPKPHVLRVANVLGQVNEEASYGVAEFTLDGHTFQLEPSVIATRKKPLFFVFRDTTSRSTTYGGGRFLDALTPSNGLSKPGTVVLDFNQARNPWCAFSVHTSCPIPPLQNRLQVAIPAGEQRYTSLTAE